MKLWDHELLIDTVEEIKQMNPNEKYNVLALNGIEYLQQMFESICASYNLGIELSKEQFIEIEKYVYNNL